MITKIDFGDLIDPLERRFRELSQSQVNVYFDILKHFEKDILKPVIQGFVEDAEKFPTPGKIKQACRDLIHKQNKDSSLHCTVKPSCQKCRNGFVQFEFIRQRRIGNPIPGYDARPCAVCNTEPSPQPHYIQIDGVIYMAAKKLPGSHLWVPDVNNRMIREDVDPIFSSDVLLEYWQEEQTGTVKPVAITTPEQAAARVRGFEEKLRRQIERHQYPKASAEQPTI